MGTFKRMGISSPTKLTDEQIDAIAAAVDSIAAIAKYSGQEGSLDIVLDGIEYEFGDNQAQVITSRAPRFAEAVNGKANQQPVVATATPYAVMGLKRKPPKPQPKLPKNEVNAAVALFNR